MKLTPLSPKHTSERCDSAPWTASEIGAGEAGRSVVFLEAAKAAQHAGGA